MIGEFDGFEINPIHEGDAWKICDFAVSNTEELKRFFPITLEQNLNPTLSQIYVEQRLKDFRNKELFVFTLKQIETRKLIGLVILKNLDWNVKQGELAYAVDYNFYGRGIISKAVSWLTKYAIEELHLTTLQIFAHKSNIPSVKVAIKNNYVWRKTIEKSFTPPGEMPLDMELYEFQKEDER